MKEVILPKDNIDCIKPNEDFLLVEKSKDIWKIIESQPTLLTAEEALQDIKDYMKMYQNNTEIQIFKREGINIGQE